MKTRETEIFFLYDAKGRQKKEVGQKENRIIEACAR